MVAGFQAMSAERQQDTSLESRLLPPALGSKQSMNLVIAKCVLLRSLAACVVSTLSEDCTFAVFTQQARKQLQNSLPSFT